MVFASFLAFCLTAAAHSNATKEQTKSAEQDAKAVIERIDQQNNRAEACEGCDIEKTTATPAATLATDDTCQKLASYPLPEGPIPGVYDNDVCASIDWKKQQETSEKASKRNLGEAMYRPDFIPDNRNQQISLGYKVLSKEQRSAFLKEAAKVKQDVAQNCCGTDKSCHKYFSKVNINFCDDSAAAKNPNIPDPCAKSGGTFYADKGNTKEFATSMLSMLDLVTARASTLPPEEKKYFFKMISYYESIGGRHDFGEISYGGIELSPYYAKTETANVQLLAHELGHACSHIKRQMIIVDMKSPTESLATAKDTLNYMFRKNSALDNCSVKDPYVLTIFEKIGANLKADAKGLVNCVATVAKSSTLAGSPTYFPETCERAKLEEGFADAMSFLVTDSIDKSQLLARCSSFASIYHPLMPDILACTLQHSPTFLQRAKEIFACAK